MKITFINVQRITPDRDGIDFLYHYQCNGDPNIKTFHGVFHLLAPSPWDLSKEEELFFSKKAFWLVIEYIKKFWGEKFILPQEKVKYFLGQDLTSKSYIETDWKNYSLELENF